MAQNSKKKSFLIIKILILLFLLACAGPFFIKDKNGKPFMSPAKIKARVSDRLITLKYFFFKPEKPSKAESRTIEKPYIPYKDREYTEMYKYRDKKGVLHFTDKKPLNINYEVMYMPVSKQKDPKKKEGLFNTLFKKNNDKQKSSPEKKADHQKTKSLLKNSPGDSGDFFSQAKKIMKTAADQYKKAPEALNEAKDLKKQVEDVYQQRENLMKENQ